MSTKLTNIIIGFLLVLSLGVAAWVYPQLPVMIASHWNAAGVVDGYANKFWGLLLVPLILAIVWLVSVLLPLVDPLRANVLQFRPIYNLFILLIVLVLTIIDKLTVLWNLGYRFPFAQAMVLLLGVLSLGIGALLPRIKRNYFMGIRTPWTLSSDVVWDETHKHGGKLFLAAGVLGVLGVLLPVPIATWVAIGSIILAAVLSIIDSFLIYRKTEHLEVNK